MSLDLLDRVDAPTLKAMLPTFLGGYLIGPPVDAPGRAAVAAEVASWTADDAAAVLAHLRGLGQEPRPYPADPRCRRVSRAWCQDAVPESDVAGVHHLDEARAAGSVLLVCNHLSFVDTTATDAALARAGRVDVADALVALAGPQVYADLFRRFASACLSTLPVPQSTRFEHTERLGARELAALARSSLDQCARVARSGGLPLLYAEGSRTRTGHLGPFLKAVYRYLACADRVVPMAVVGTERIMPVGATTLTPGAASIRFGPAVRIEDARADLARVHAAVAELLPPTHCPEAGCAPVA